MIQDVKQYSLQYIEVHVREGIIRSKNDRILLGVKMAGAYG
jgi:hypothetical protein